MARLGPWLMPVLVWAVVLGVQRRGLPDPRLRLQGLEILAPGTGAEVAERDSTYYQVRLRDRTEFTLRHRFPGSSGPDGQPLALYVPSVGRNVEVFVNGTRIGDGGRLVPPVDRNRHRPLFFPVPAGLVRAGENTLDLRVVSSHPDRAFIRPVYFGPLSALERPYQWQYAFKVTSMQVIVVTLVLLVLFVGALWLKARRETVYAWFAAGLLFWSVYNANYLTIRHPVDDGLRIAMMHGALGAFLHCMIFFVHRLVGLRPARLEQALWVVTVASITTMMVGAWALDPERLWVLINQGYRFIPLVLGSYLLVRLVGLCRQKRTPALFWLASATALTFSFGVHDSLRQLGVLDPLPPNLMQYGALAALLVFGYLLVDRFAGALRESEELNRALDAKVQAKTRALAEQFERTRELEREMVLAQERERLVRDMHDGLGGHLVSLLTLVRSGRGEAPVMEEVLVDCLGDLRLMIDSLDTAGEDLAVGLGMFRARFEPRLRAAGLEVHWDVRDLPPGLRLGPEGVLQVFRILQEAIQNAIKHAQARTLWIQARRAAGKAPRLELIVRDDGIGLGRSPAAGRGLTHMRRRAQMIAGTVRVEEARPGTQVALLLPLLA